MGISSELKFGVSHVEGDFRSRSISPSISKGLKIRSIVLVASPRFMQLQ